MSVKPVKYYLTFVVWGFFFWVAFLAVMRLLGPVVFSTKNPLLFALFILSIPVVWVIIWGVAKLTRTPINEMLVPIVIIDFSALLLDGLAVGFTDVYGSTADQIAASAAYLLWGVALTLIMALWLSYRQVEN